jgi:hypothetical protein
VDTQDELEIVRQINIEFSITAAEEEKQRRVRELENATAQEELLRERNAAAATAAIESERLRRMEEIEQVAVQNEAERRRSQQCAVEVSYIHTVLRQLIRRPMHEAILVHRRWNVSASDA